MPEAQPQVTTGTESHNWKKVAITVLIIIVVAGLIVAAYWFLVLNKSSENSDFTGPVPKVTTQTSTESAEEATEAAETSGWKTHSSSKGNFQINYPNNWFVYSLSTNVDAEIFGVNSVDIETTRDSDKNGLPQSFIEVEVTTDLKFKFPEGEDIKIGNLNGIKEVIRQPCSGLCTRVYVYKSPNVYRISFGGNEAMYSSKDLSNYEDTFSKMLDTFELLE